MKELIERIRTEIEAFNENSEKQINGNKAAGARARKNALNLMNDLKQFRKVSVDYRKED